MPSWIDDLYAVFTQDAGGRGLGGVIGPESFSEAINQLIKADRVLMMTGFFIADALRGETDGPPGTMTLARALVRLGKTVMVLTDDYSEPLLRSCAEVLAVDGELTLRSLPQDTSLPVYQRVMDTFEPDVVISIERPGMNREGKCLSMSRVDLSAYVPCFDPLFRLAFRAGIPTIAIGDGANELGMGSLPPEALSNVLHGDEIAAVTGCDHLIVAGVSNWGGAALVAGLSCLCGENLLHTADQEVDMVEAMIDAGGIDGKRKEAIVSVDGLDMVVHREIIRQMHGIIGAAAQVS